MVEQTFGLPEQIKSGCTDGRKRHGGENIRGVMNADVDPGKSNETCPEECKPA